MVVLLALLAHIEVLIRRPPIVKGFMCVNTMVPVVIFGLVCTVSGLIPIHVEDDWINGFQVDFKPLLKGHLCPFAVCCELMQDLSHLLNVNDTVIGINEWISG